ncbi:putative P-type ATPase [Leptomonas pyrrhocoris]|uniref:P-type Cu(+) transporter n=1 Tax=Leptomonas pyrrhocoris TaxID=157538 RepID=A0A0M9FU55_LEPPY|nr:putative P-type ATPase [Leptomonas pyrrhocoris]KPA76150.1 putative P-type ATPase [Leptomonas pyrrhocoris]|eukprot:XP_015654589.1 putative P-type ATPase [Leptomonas pyrrhocoris]
MSSPIFPAMDSSPCERAGDTSDKPAKRSSFTIQPEALHELVNEGSEGTTRRLASLGGLEGLAAHLKTDLAKGIDVSNPAALAERRAAFSVNELPAAEETSFLDMVLESLEDRMMQILIVSAVVSLVLGLTVPDPATGSVDYRHGWIEGAAILLSVTLVTFVSSVNNYQKEQKFKELTKATPPVKVQVIRSGTTVEITDKELLSGDLLTVAGGDVLTVDGVVLRSTSLKVDESAATGENDDVPKSAHGDYVLRSGTNVTEGEGTILVMGVGVHSFAGHIAMQVRQAKEETPLQEKLTELADLIGYFGMIAAGLMFVLLSGKEFLDTVVYRKHPIGYKKYLDNLTTAVTIVVVAVPEGLPLSVTIALAYSMKQMLKENNLVRHLAACETMGSATTICTDKTGTITQNDMCVTDGVTSYGTAYVVPRKMADGSSRPHSSSPSEVTVSSTSSVSATTRSPPQQQTVDILNTSAVAGVRQLLMECITMNTKSTRTLIESPRAQHASVRLTGSKTEQALLNFVDALGEDPMQLRTQRLGTLQKANTQLISSPYTPIPWPAGQRNNVVAAAATFTMDLHLYPFTSARKRMTTALMLRAENIVRYYVKGASELILAECSHTFNAAGARVAVSHEVRVQLEEAIMAMARRQLRTIAVAYADHPIPFPSSAAAKGGGASGDFTASPFVADDTQLEGLTLLGIVGIRDPVRAEVPEAIAQCRRAGVVVRMITGDNKATAVSIAKEVGIYGEVWAGPAQGEQGLALEGPQFRELARSARKLNAILPRLQVISRASPLDKRILVSALMQRGEVVAVTGDGTNDAPALKGANVGFSMNSGTEVAKLASDVVILDDNFSTIVTAMKWGRNVNDNISKFLQFQMTVNVAAVLVSFLGALLDGNGESPLKPVQLLWLNLIMDTLAALALATETPSNEVLLRSPKAKAAPLITRRMWLNIGGQSIYQILLQLWLIHGGAGYFGLVQDSEEHFTVVFNTFVLLQLCNEFNARLLGNEMVVWHNIRHAPMFLLVVGSTFVIQILAVQYGGALMRCVPLSAELWKKCFLLSVVPLPLGILLRRMNIHEKTVPPPPPIVDEAEEAALQLAEKQRTRPTLRKAAATVCAQLRVVRAFQSNMQERKKARIA